MANIEETCAEWRSEGPGVLGMIPHSVLPVDAERKGPRLAFASGILVIMYSESLSGETASDVWESIPPLPRFQTKLAARGDLPPCCETKFRRCPIPCQPFQPSCD